MWCQAQPRLRTLSPFDWKHATPKPEAAEAPIDLVLEGGSSRVGHQTLTRVDPANSVNLPER